MKIEKEKQFKICKGLVKFFLLRRFLKYLFTVSLCTLMSSLTGECVDEDMLKQTFSIKIFKVTRYNQDSYYNLELYVLCNLASAEQNDYKIIWVY